MTILKPPIHEFTYEKATVRVFHVNKGEGLPKHSHTFSHATMCNAGSCLVSLEGRQYKINKYSKPLNLPAGE